MDKTNDKPLSLKSLLLPNAKSPRGRRVWSIDLEMVWLPLFYATNTMGDTAIPADALGAPIRLAYEKDGSVRFSKTGRPVTRVAKPISASVAFIKDNFVAYLQLLLALFGYCILRLLKKDTPIIILGVFCSDECGDRYAIGKRQEIERRCGCRVILSIAEDN